MFYPYGLLYRQEVACHDQQGVVLMPNWGYAQFWAGRMQVSDTTLDSPTRAQILDILRGSSDGQTVKDVAAMVGIHPNVARTHLTKLAQAKLVS